MGLDEAWSQIGKGGDQLIPVFVPAEERKRLEDDIQQFRSNLMKREYMPRFVPFAKGRKLLARVKRSGIKIVLATSANAEDLTFYKRLVEIEDLVEERPQVRMQRDPSLRRTSSLPHSRSRELAQQMRSRWAIPLMTLKRQESWAFRPSASPAEAGRPAIF